MSFFKAYDMRGTYGTDFNLATIREVGRALVETIGAGRWLIGRDCRVTSSNIRDALIDGLTSAGANVVDMGLCTTPMVYFFTASDNYDASVMITASHNPPTDNGLKVSMKMALPVGYANGLDKVEEIVARRSALINNSSYLPAKRNDSDNKNYITRYVRWMQEHATAIDQSLTFAVDCSNGMASLIVKELFSNAVIINSDIDGTFPSHSPNPLNPEARNQIAEVVRSHQLDFGVIFDGDADRAMFVDEHGDFVQPDYLTALIAKETIEQLGLTAEESTVIYDVRTSRATIEAVHELNATGLMVPVGHALAKPILRKSGAICGGELAGHYYFKEFFCCDSAVLATLRMSSVIAKAKRNGLSFSELIKQIKSRYANSGEMNFKVTDNDKAIANVLAAAKNKLPAEISRSEIDGVRIEYKEGWINIRKSNTEQLLRLVIETDNEERLRQWIQTLSAAIEESDK